MAYPATVIILTAGGLTTFSEWWQTKQLNWRIPVATVLLAALFDVFSKIDEKAATLSSVIVLIGAATAEFNGKSAASILSELYPNSVAGKAGTSTTTRKVA